MKELNVQQWGDVAPRLTNRACAICGKHHISHEPRYAEIGGIDILITTCAKCGHVDLYDVTELASLAKSIDRELRGNDMM